MRQGDAHKMWTPPVRRLLFYRFVKILEGYDCELRPINLLEDVEMGIVGDDVFGIGCHGTIHELIVVWVGFYQSEVDIDFLKLGGVQPSNGLYHVVGNLQGGLLGEYFLILVQYVGIDAQDDVTRQYLSPYLMIRTAAGQ